MKSNMNNQADLQALQQTEVFRGLRDEVLLEVLAAGQEQRAAEGHFFFYQDEPAVRVFILKEGRVKLTQVTIEGQQVLMQVVTPGMMFAAIGMVPGSVYPLSAQAAEDCLVLSWRQDELMAIMERHTELAFRAMKFISDHIREFQDRYRELATERVERRLAHMLLRLAEQAGKTTAEGILLDMPITRQDLAEMSGTTLYTVSRILSQWEGRGLVESGRERVMIRSLEDLERIAEDQS